MSEADKMGNFAAILLGFVQIADGLLRICSLGCYRHSLAIDFCRFEARRRMFR